MFYKEFGYGSIYYINEKPFQILAVDQARLKHLTPVSWDEYCKFQGKENNFDQAQTTELYIACDDDSVDIFYPDDYMITGEITKEEIDNLLKKRNK